MEQDDLPNGAGPRAEGTPGQPVAPTARRYTMTALPSSGARLLAFLAIVVAGLCGGLIGWSVADLQCGGLAGDRANGDQGERAVDADAGDDGCTPWSAGGALIGAVMGAGGVGVVSVLVLRAMGEWRRALDVEELPRVAGNP